jgi:hypothetical protein
VARVVFHGTRDELRRLLRELPRILAGHAPDPLGVAKGLQLRLGVALLSKVQQAFVVKSRGGTGDDGIKWPPMKPASIAQRRTTAGERKQLGITGKRVRGLLTPAEDKRWRQIFAQRKWLFVTKFGMGDREASERAAQIAWAVLKSSGAKTKLAVLGGRQVDMCRDTSRYFRSLSPGVEDRPSGEAEQVFQVSPGRVIVGTNVPYAGRQHKLRPLWPAGGQLPAAWWKHLLQVAVRGVARAASLLVQTGRP